MLKYRLLGRSGLRVSEICLGTMTFGEEWQWGSSKEESRKVFNTYLEAGGNFIDTANKYTEGTSEKLLGEFMGKERDRLVLATKFTLNLHPEDINSGGNHRKNIRQSLEESLKRLKTDYIDLYWLHVWDRVTPIDEVMRTLDDLVQAGKVLYVGISDAPAWLIARANTLAEWRGWAPFIAMQMEYSLLERAPERELFPMADALGIGITAWSPLGMGILTGKYNRKASDEKRRLDVASYIDVSERNLAIAEEVQKMAQECGKSPAQVAIAWVMQRGNIIPIIGAKNVNQLQDNLKSVELTLTPEQMQRLDTASKIDLGFPNDFLAKRDVLELIWGKTYDKLDRHWVLQN